MNRRSFIRMISGAVPPSRPLDGYCRNWAKMAYYYNGLHGNVQLFTYLYPWPGNGAKVCEEKKRSRNEEGIFQY